MTWAADLVSTNPVDSLVKVTGMCELVRKHPPSATCRRSSAIPLRHSFEGGAAFCPCEDCDDCFGREGGRLSRIPDACFGSILQKHDRYRHGHAMSAMRAVADFDFCPTASRPCLSTARRAPFHRQSSLLARDQLASADRKSADSTSEKSRGSETIWVAVCGLGVAEAHNPRQPCVALH